MTIPEKAVAWAVEIAENDSHGYDQGGRWGPDYDCSSLVISAYKHAGVPLTSTYTGNMRADFLAHGFKDVTDQVNLSNGAGFELGDVLLNYVHHTALYWRNGRIIHAAGNEHGGATGGQTGDQTGREICSTWYFNYPWDCVLRYSVEPTPEPTPEPSEDTYIVQPNDTLWDIARRYGVSVNSLAELNNIQNPSLIYPGQIIRLKETAPQPQPEPSTDITEVAKAVIRGDYGNGLVRIIKLRQAGYDYDQVQAEVNRILANL